jgi:hypothetical protein
LREDDFLESGVEAEDDGNDNRGRVMSEDGDCEVGCCEGERGGSDGDDTSNVS